MWFVWTGVTSSFVMNNEIWAGYMCIYICVYIFLYICLYICVCSMFMCSWVYVRRLQLWWFPHRPPTALPPRHPLTQRLQPLWPVTTSWGVQGPWKTITVIFVSALIWSHGRRRGSCEHRENRYYYCTVLYCTASTCTVLYCKSQCSELYLLCLPSALPLSLCVFVSLQWCRTLLLYTV